MFFSINEISTIITSMVRRTLLANITSDGWRHESEPQTCYLLPKPLEGYYILNSDVETSAAYDSIIVSVMN